jgi:hypothetical protein
MSCEWIYISSQSCKALFETHSMGRKVCKEHQENIRRASVRSRVSILSYCPFISFKSLWGIKKEFGAVWNPDKMRTLYIRNKSSNSYHSHETARRCIDHAPRNVPGIRPRFISQVRIRANKQTPLITFAQHVRNWIRLGHAPSSTGGVEDPSLAEQ